MYQIYKLTFGKRVYIGCTNNIRRRKNQHNENARNRKSKLGKYLADNGLVLTINDFLIIASEKDRPKAFEIEKAAAVQEEKTGSILLNDNYSMDCTRKGKNIGNTAKNFVVIDFVEHTMTEVTDLRQYCQANGLDYKLLHRTAKSGHEYKNRYCAFSAEEWAKEPNKEKYLDGSFVNEVMAKAREDSKRKMAKWYEVKFPDGHTEVVFNLNHFAAEHNLTAGTLHATLINNKATKGYQVIRRI